MHGAGVAAVTCNCDVGMCTHRSDCRQHRAHINPDLVPLEYTRAVYEGKAVARDPVPIRSKSDQIARIRRRLDQVNDGRNPLVPILKAILDLLEDEL